MNKFIVGMVLTFCMIFAWTMVLANPNMLPAHPGYPMDAAKSPVTGQSLANDPGETSPSAVEAVKAAAEFHDSQVMNPQKEVRPNIVYKKKEKENKN